jgi:hypothetical protein
MTTSRLLAAFMSIIAFINLARMDTHPALVLAGQALMVGLCGVNIYRMARR